MELGDPRSLEAVVDVLSSDAVAIQPNAMAELEGWGDDRAIEARVRRVEPSAFTKVSSLGVAEQRVNVVLDLTEIPRGLGDGFRVEARILTAEARAVLVCPVSALFRQGTGWAVFTIEAGKAVLRPIEVGKRGRIDVEVTRGLGEGAEVIVFPTDRIRDGVSVDSGRL
jgi:HlyD family secretion protein